MNQPEESIEAQAQNMLRRKDAPRRFMVSMFVMNQLLTDGQSLVGNGSQEDRLLNWNLCVDSIFDLWESSTILWLQGKFAIASALAITTIEESGKLAAERMRMAGANKIEISEEDRLKLSSEWNLRNKPFLDHHTKTMLAAMSGALINNRLDRIVGIDFVLDFLANAENGKVEAFRQSCLYLDRKNEALLRPQEFVSADTSSRYVALAGEIFVELLFDPGQWGRYLSKIEDFEIQAGLIEKSQN